MHSLKLKKLSPTICYFNSSKKFNMMLLYFLSATAPGQVLYNGKHKILIQDFFPNHEFRAFKSLQDLWSLPDNVPKYLVMDKLNRGFYDFIMPTKSLCKIKAHDKIYGTVIYPSRGRFMTKYLYQIFDQLEHVAELTETDLLIYNMARCMRHTANCPGLKKYCHCRDCWTEMEIIRCYLNNNMKSRNLLHSVRVILKKIKSLNF